MKKIFFIALGIATLVSCGTSQQLTQERDNTRWPDFLREWSSVYEINDDQRLSLINLIDSVYCILEDNTQSVEEHSSQICRMFDRMAEVIANDSVFEFTLMMRATAANYLKCAYMDDRIFQCECSEESFNRLAEWQTVSTENVDLMYHTIIPESWHAPYHFANVIFVMGKEDEEPSASCVITNYEDYQMDSVRITFLDSAFNVLEVLREEEVFVDSTNAEGGVKMILILMSICYKACCNPFTLISLIKHQMGGMKCVVSHHSFLMNRLRIVRD